MDEECRNCTPLKYLYLGMRTASSETAMTMSAQVFPWVDILGLARVAKPKRADMAIGTRPMAGKG
jgi:hypothetical protein